MDETVTALGFLGLAEEAVGDSGKSPDVVILPVPYELTTSYGQGTADGPAACIAASAQVELHDPLLPADLPCGFQIVTHAAWNGEGGTLAAQQDGIVDYLSPHLNGLVSKPSANPPTGDRVRSPFPLILGGEHGILPAVMQALSCVSDTETLSLDRLTLVQIDAHADLRDELDGEPMSHACAARRALDAGIGRLVQIGIRAYCREEEEFAQNDYRVETHFAQDLLAPSTGEAAWADLLSTVQAIDGPVWLTFDIDGLDGSLVPTTGTPVPGGLTWWHAVSLIETLFASPTANILGADIVEIVPSKEGNLTEFTAAMLVTKIIAAHLANRLTVSDENNSASLGEILENPTENKPENPHAANLADSKSFENRPIGSHVMLDYTGWKSPHGAAESWLIKIMREAAAAAGARIVHSHAEPFDGTISPTGFAAVVLIDESHISAHCYEENGLLAIDCFTCGDVSAVAVADRLHTELSAVVPTLNLVKRHTVERFISNGEKNSRIVP
jgi:agmatinase